MWEFWYDYVKEKYEEKVKLCYMDWYNFISCIKTKGAYISIAKDVNTKFDTSNYELYRTLPRNKK